MLAWPERMLSVRPLRRSAQTATTAPAVTATVANAISTTMMASIKSSNGFVNRINRNYVSSNNGNTTEAQ